MKEYRGNLHVHTTISDGTLATLEVAKIAREVGLDFVGINDHHVTCTDNRYIQGVLMLMGTEYNSSHSHYLAYNACNALDDKQVDGARVVSHVKECKGMGIIAHPFEKGSPVVSGGKHYPWRDWNVNGYDGIELWNLSSQWKDAATGVGHALRTWFFNRYQPFLQGPCAKSIAKWDEVCQKRHVTGVAGSDLHAPFVGIKRRYGFKVLDYPMLLGAVNNYVLAQEPTGDGDVDSLAVIQGLRRGRCWFAFDWLHSGSGFEFEVSTQDGVYTMGDRVPQFGEIIVRTPTEATILLKRNGAIVHETTGRKLNYTVSQWGVYRVEALISRRGKFVPWLFSNPIYIEKE